MLEYFLFKKHHTPLAVVKFTGKRKKIKSSYFIATPIFLFLRVPFRCAQIISTMTGRNARGRVLPVFERKILEKYMDQ
jgi:hypothetical protein